MLDTTDQQGFADVCQELQPTSVRFRADGKISDDEVVTNSAALADAIALVLSGTGYSALRNVEFEIENGIVLLRGSVPSHHQKQVAQTVAQTVPGIRNVANGIEVDCARKS
jgi:osmotically-inducible protein OsmY